MSFTEKEQAEMRRMYEAGAPIESIGERFGIHRVSVRQIMKRMGVPLRAHGGARNTGEKHIKRHVVRSLGLGGAAK